MNWISKRSLHLVALAPLLIVLSSCAASPADKSIAATTPHNKLAPTQRAGDPDNSPPWAAPVPEGGRQEKIKRLARPRLPLPPSQEPVQLRYPRNERPWLGVELRATPKEEPGVKIARVLPGSPAEAAKLRAGDIIVSMGETPVQTPADVSAWVRSQPAETAHPLAVLRNGSQVLIRAHLQGMPEFEDRLRLALVGRPAPEIAGVATFQGEATSLRDLKGQVVILEFWASYCGVCRYLAPVLDEWHRTYQPQGAHVFGITVDAPKLGKQVAEQTGMHYTLASDTQARVSRTYLASQIPAVFVIDRNGIVRDVMVGYSKARLIETRALIQSLLRQDP